MIPASLQYPENPLKISSGWTQLSEELFGELSAALNAAAPPDAAVLFAEFEQWQQFEPVPGPNVVDKATVASWLEAYAVALEQRETAKDAYTSSAAHLLRGRGTVASVPFVVAWQNKSSARVLKLETVSVSGGAGRFWLHPSFAHRRSDLRAETGQFLAAITDAWASACSQSPQPVQVDVFWQLTTDDGGALPALQLDGPSASAAAFRAFWHIIRDLQIDPDVYVLADATSSDGRIEAVGQLREKINCIQAAQSSRNACPPTLVAAQRLSDDDLAAFRGASTWAEVVQVATIEDLMVVRSCTTSAVIAYMEHLAEKLDETPWTRDGKPVRLSDVHVPPQVWKDEYSFHSAAEDEQGAEQRDWRPAGYDPAGADREVAPRLKQQRRKVLVPWKSEFARPQHQPIVIVGGPGFGKTSLLRWTARELILESLGVLHARTKAWSEVRWPIITDLAAWLSKGGDPHDALRDSALDFAPLPKTHPKLQRETVPHVVETRLIAQTENTYLFLDALDQVPVSQLRILRGRLGGLGSIAPRLVFSTREVALSTHLPNTSFPRLTILEAAALSTEDARALAAKWLDSDLATRLEAHLRAQPAMSVVADSPLLLTLACGIISHTPNTELPETAAYLYRDLMQSLARGEWRDSVTGTDAAHDPDELLARLRLMAWRLFSREAGTNRFGRDALIRALNGSGQADAALSQLCHLGFLEGSGLSQGEPYYQFRHATFLEFLAAAHLTSEIDANEWDHATVTHWHNKEGWRPIKVSQMLDANAFEPACEPLFAFTAGLMRQPRPLLSLLAERNKDDTYRYRLGLLCRCYGSLAADKEDGVEDLMDRVLRTIESRGRMAWRAWRSSDRLKRWLVIAGHLLNLPKAGSRVIKVLAVHDDRAHRIQGGYELLEVLSRAAQHSRCNAGMEALLAICEGDVLPAYQEVGQAATKAVALADRLGLPQIIKRLELAMDAAVEKPYKQIDLARALLRVRDARVAKKAFDLLTAIAENKAAEDWCRGKAVEGFVETLDTPLEAQGVAVMESYLFAPSHGVARTREWDAACDLMRVVQSYPSETITSKLLIQRLVLREAFDGFYLPHFRTALIRSDDATARMLGIQLLIWAARGETNDCYTRTRAAKDLLKHGGDSEREEALSILKGMTKTPIGDGRSRMLALSVLLEAGHTYNDEVKQCLHEFGVADGVNSHWVVDAAEIAQERGDTVLFEVLMPRLRWIINNWKPDVNCQNDEPSWSDRDGVTELLFGTSEWESLERNAFVHLRGDVDKRVQAWFSVDVICRGAKSSDLVKLSEETLAVGKRDFRPWERFFRELALRGWRFQVSGRKFVILRRGQEEPRADAAFRYRH